jgi:hypothetical protein
MNKPEKPEMLQRFMNSFSDEEKDDFLELEDEAQAVSRVLMGVAKKKKAEKEKKNVPNTSK